jgi:hypothetical protein
MRFRIALLVAAWETLRLRLDTRALVVRRAVLCAWIAGAKISDEQHGSDQLRTGS